VSYGWNFNEFFFIPKKVDRVTKTQFVVGSRRFKKNGREIGVYLNYAYLEGEKVGWRFGKIVKDQTKEMVEFELKLKTERRIKDKIEGIEIPSNSDLTLKELEAVEAHIDRVVKMTNEVP